MKKNESLSPGFNVTIMFPVADCPWRYLSSPLPQPLLPRVPDDKCKETWQEANFLFVSATFSPSSVAGEFQAGVLAADNWSGTGNARPATGLPVIQLLETSDVAGGWGWRQCLPARSHPPPWGHPCRSPGTPLGRCFPSCCASKPISPTVQCAALI